MKTKFLLPFLAVGMIVMSCNKSKESTDSVAEVPVVDMTGAEVRALMVANGQSKWNYQDVLELANASMDMLDQTYPSRSGSRSIANIVPVVGESKAMTNGTRTASIDTSMYIVNFADSMGYAIVSNDKMVQKVIAVVENGSLSSISEVGNGDMPALYHSLLAYIAERDYMNQNKDSLANSAQAKLASATPYADDNGFNYVYSPWFPLTPKIFMDTKWGYVDEADLMPNVKVCNHKMSPNSVIAAIAQVVTYHQFPSSYMGHTYQWHPDFRDYPFSATSIQPSSLESIENLYVDIMTTSFSESNKRCTRRSCSNYGKVSICGASGAEATLRSMGYSNLKKYSTDISKDVIYDNLVTRRIPAIVGGNNQYGEGYSWVVDGYKGDHRTISVYDAVTGVLYYKLNDLDRFNLVHCNMGAYGLSNGYFNMFSYDINKPVELDYSLGGVIEDDANSNYSRNLQFLFVSK